MSWWWGWKLFSNPLISVCARLIACDDWLAFPWNGLWPSGVSRITQVYGHVIQRRPSWEPTRMSLQREWRMKGHWFKTYVVPWTCNYSFTKGNCKSFASGRRLIKHCRSGSIGCCKCHRSSLPGLCCFYSNALCVSRYGYYLETIHFCSWFS